MNFSDQRVFFIANNSKNFGLIHQLLAISISKNSFSSKYSYICLAKLSNYILIKNKLAIFCFITIYTSIL